MDEEKTFTAVEGYGGTTFHHIDTAQANANTVADMSVRLAQRDDRIAELLQLLATLESCVQYRGDRQIVQCPCCAAACTMEQWHDGIAPDHSDDCEWVAARQALGIVGVPGIPE